MPLVGQHVRLQLELIGAERAALPHQLLRPLLDQFQIGAGHLMRRRARRLVHQHHFGAQGHHHAGPLPRVALGHDRDEGMPQRPAHEGQSRPRVAAGQFDHRLAGRQFAPLARGVHHFPGNPVFFGEARVEVIEQDLDELGPEPYSPVDTDADGTPDFHDVDSDGDTIVDLIESASDYDADGTANYRDDDSDDDCIADRVEARGNHACGHRR